MKAVLIIAIVLFIIEILTAVLLFNLFSRWNKYLEKRIHDRALVRITLSNGRVIVSWMSIRDLPSWQQSSYERGIVLSTRKGSVKIVRGEIVSIDEIIKLSDIIRNVF